MKFLSHNFFLFLRYFKLRHLQQQQKQKAKVNKLHRRIELMCCSLIHLNFEKYYFKKKIDSKKEEEEVSWNKY